MYKLLVVCAFALSVVGCNQILVQGETVSENQEWLDFNVTEYDYQDYHVVWTYHYKQGLLGISTPQPLRTTRQVIYLKDGKIAKAEDLGSDRKGWVAKLKDHGVKWSDGVFWAIEQKQVIVGMTLDQVMVSLGHPQVSPPFNYKVTRKRNELKADDKLYYPMYRFEDGLYVHVVMKSGVVVALEGVRPGVFQEHDRWGVGDHPVR
ncbi:MAG: hypothetical protein AAB389_03235 [Patescibacteria group bacterium]